MTKRYFVIALAWLLQAASWFLPAVKGFLGSRLDQAIPGWSVFLASAYALRPWGDASDAARDWTAISAAGVVTTVLFVFGSPWIAYRASRTFCRASAFAAAAAFVVNSQWYLFYVPFRSDLGVGYFFWCSSFGLLAIGLFLLPGATNRRVSTQQKSAPILS